MEQAGIVERVRDILGQSTQHFHQLGVVNENTLPAGCIYRIRGKLKEEAGYSEPEL